MRGKVRWKSLAVFGRLNLDPRQRGAFSLCLNYPGGFAVHIQKIIRGPKTACQGKISERDAPASTKIGALHVLDFPAGLLQRLINPFAGFVFWSHSSSTRIEKIRKAKQLPFLVEEINEGAVKADSIKTCRSCR